MVRGEGLDDRPRLGHLAEVPAGATTPGRWVDAMDLRVGDELLLIDGRIEKVERIHLYRSFVTVYNFEVDDLHCYAVGRSGVLVHNGNGNEASLPRFWNRSTNFQGNKVFQRNDIIDPARLDALGRTNLQRMQKGLAPIGPDGKSINLHHMIQRQDGAIAEMTATFHQQYSRIIHINPNTIPSGIDRPAFENWRAAYWQNRANDFLSP